jgi:hypothetical protein
MILKKEKMEENMVYYNGDYCSSGKTPSCVIRQQNEQAIKNLQNKTDVGPIVAGVTLGIPILAGLIGAVVELIQNKED